MGKNKKQKQIPSRPPKMKKGKKSKDHKGKTAERIKAGKAINKTQDPLFLGRDYREILNWQYDRQWPDILADVANWTPIPFTIGIEMELIIAYADGSYPPGNEMVFRMKESVKDAIKIMDQILYEGRSDFLRVPDYIHSKVLARPFYKDDIEKGGVMDIRYRLPPGNVSEYVDIDCFGRDGNVTAITYILELVTPPCEYVEELAYWASTLFQLAKKTLPKDLNIIASGINPTARQYLRGLTQSLHVHLGGFVNDVEKAQVYNMIRNFIPHLIALSTNSPIMNSRPTDVIKIIGNRVTAPNCVRSLRLKYNSTMLSSNEPRNFIPYLTSTNKEGINAFLSKTRKANLEDARMEDIFPFTDFGTIEFRIFDQQISMCRRIGLAMLIQALAYKARKILASRKWVPDAGAATISTNRKGAYERGLISLFTPQVDYRTLAKSDPFFAEQYLGPQNQPVRYMTHAVQRMFFYLKNELKELGFLYSPFLKPLLQSVFGSVSYAEPPITEAEYQLSLYATKQKRANKNIVSILEDLIYFTDLYSQDPIDNPLTGTLTLPIEMR